MRVLLIHPNFPGQLRHVAAALGRSKDNVVVFATKNARHEWVIPGVSKALYVPDGSVNPAHRLVDPFQESVLQGEAMYKLAQTMKAQGFVPDVIYANSGWGNTLYIKDVWPDVPLQCYFEWFYDPAGRDATFDAKPPGAGAAPPPKLYRTRNASIFNDLWACDQGVSPTQWQKSQFPDEYQDKITVLHDGVDTEFFKPDPDARLVLEGLDLTGAKEIVTFAARGMEPYRGFPQFLQAADMILRKRPGAHIVVAGSERICYGSARRDGRSWKEVMLARLKPDRSRLHFVGSLPYGLYKRLLQCSTVHVYLTRPFVLSWSAIEAMACGCCLVASDTEPVREVMVDGENALLTDFHDAHAIAGRIEQALDDAPLRARMGEGARTTAVGRYALKTLLPRHLELLLETARQGG